MLLVFRSMQPPSLYQNKALHLSAWLLLFTYSHANAFRSLCTLITACTECTTCNTHTVHGNTHIHTQKHTEHILFCPLSSLSAKQLQTQNTLFPSYSSLSPLSHTPSHRLSFCLPLSSSSPSFLPFSCLSAEQQREAAIDTHALSLFYCSVEWRERGEQHR